jgi:hypothetical protein
VIDRQRRRGDEHGVAVGLGARDGPGCEPHHKIDLSGRISNGVLGDCRRRQQHGRKAHPKPLPERRHERFPF